MNEELTVFERPAKVAALSVNGAGFTDLDFRREVERLESETGVPVVDPCREGPGRLVEILRDHERQSSQQRRQAQVTTG